MRLLVIESSHTAPVGMIGTALKRLGATLVTVRAENREPLPDGPAGFDGLLVLGGPQDAWDDAQGPHFPQTMRLIRDFAEDRPVMGLCLGGQLAARAFGAEVRRNPAGPELGFHPLRIEPDAADDPLLHDAGPVRQVAQWHFDRFDLPAGGVRLASNDHTPVQAFRMGRFLYGFQFHPEADAAILRDWRAEMAAGRRGATAPPAEAIDAQIAAHMPAAESFAETLARRWLDLAAG